MNIRQRGWPVATGAALGLQTGDVLLCSGKGLSSDIIRWFTGSHWTHVGVIVELDGVEEPLVLESNRGPESADLFEGQPLTGITLVPLSRKLADYHGDVMVRRRDGAPLCPRRRRLARRLVQRLYRRPYRHYLWRQLLDLLPHTRRRDYSALFCSELVAEFYRRLGWLPADLRTGAVVPADFAEDRLALVDGFLHPPVWLKRDSGKNSWLTVAGR